MKVVLESIEKIPEGYSLGIYNHKKYGISKETFTNGKSFKIFANELGGTDFVSLNYYKTKDNGLLKPCEMPAEKVIDFLKKIEIKVEK